MPKWTPNPMTWKDEDACIIGGGASLTGFPFDRLKGRNVIGCNDAFRLGSEIVKICIFGDASWFHRNKWDIEKFSGDRVTCAPSLMCLVLPWLKLMNRQREGLHTGHLIGWNHSTGAAAVNLALSLGASRVFLLGFDMGRKTDGTTHWHKHQFAPVQDAAYNRFIRGFGVVYRELVRFPGVRVFNVTDGDSKLPYFPRMTFATFWKYVPLAERKPCVACEERKQERIRA